MNEELVLVISGHGANDAIRGLMFDYAAALESAGLSIVHISTEPAEMQYGLELMRKGSVKFALTWLGIAQNLTIQRDRDGPLVNAFELCGVPLVKLQGDLPAYFEERHWDLPRNAVNLYQAEEFVHYRRRWLSSATAFTSLIPPMPMVPMDRRRVDLASRRGGKLYFLKNGNSPAALKDLWRSRLPLSTSALLLSLASAVEEVGVRPGPFHIGDFVADFIFRERMIIDPPSQLVAFLSAQMDDYLRRVKSTMIVEAILDLPVIVQGKFWNHVDFTGKQAELVDAQDVDASQRIVEQQLGVIDMAANVDTWPHDRVQRAAGSFSLVLTNHQGWLSRSFPQFEGLTFKFESESIKERVQDVIAHPERYLEQALEFGAQFREVFPRAAFAARVIELVELARLHWNEPKPALQNFFSWPRR